MSNRRRLKQQHATSSSSAAATDGSTPGGTSNAGRSGSPSSHPSSKHRSSADKKTGTSGSAGSSKGCKGAKIGGAGSGGGMVKWACLALVLFSLGLYAFRAFQQMSFRNRAVTPFPEQILDKDFSMPYKDAALFWGSYRPGVYFGMKARSAQSPVFGLMWLVQFDRHRQDFRHNCDQQHNLPRYGWLAHDGVNFGDEEIVEKDFTLRVSFVKMSGVGSHGGDWTAQIEVTLNSNTQQSTTAPPPPSHLYVSLFFYVALDGQGELESIVENEDNFVSKVRGYSNELGYFDVVFDKQLNVKYNYLEAHTPSLHLIKEAVQHYAESMSMKSPAALKGNHFVVLPGSKMEQIRQNAGNPNLPLNLIVSQASANVATQPFSLEVRFESASFTNREMTGPLSGSKFSKNLQQHIDTFHSRFETTFHLNEKGFSEEEVKFAEAVFSNLIGGMGHFFGASAVQTENYHSPLAYWYTSLFTAVPSRSFFPRGFLWDEGFHQLVVSKWNHSITEDVLSHWLDLMNVDGWIPREQILGSEALSRVPREFIVQHTSDANPPSFFLTVDSLLSNNKLSKLFIQKAYAKLKQWVGWFNTTQSGPVESSYQWRGRNGSTELELNPKTLTSGLDDYPRASHPTKEEYHVDLRCWMALTARVLCKLAQEIDHEDSASLQSWSSTLSNFELLNELHWSAELQYYTDIGIDTKDITLVSPRKASPQATDKPMVRRVNSWVPTSPVHVAHLGYVSLFPFMMRLIPADTEQLEASLTHIRDPNTLWTPYGVRSLSRKDPMYMKRNTEHDPPYWRGQIWLNMNFLILRALRHYALTEKGPYSEKAKQVYSELRHNLISNIIKQYKLSGYVWEQYKDSTGQGQGAHPFTGWTSLVILIMAEQYV